jgi:holo-[acyl-carrier protein] synthase
MIYGIGTDLILVARVRKVLQRFGARFARRILCDEELLELRESRVPERFLAKRFAAKEAFSKAIGTGIRRPVTWRYIRIGHDSSGKPIIEPHPALAAFMRERHIGAHHVSITDEQDLAAAVVVLERG